MKILTAAFFCVLFICAGCGSQKYWYNEEKSFSKARLECTECLSLAQSEVLEAAAQERKEYGVSSNVYEPYRYTFFEKCMKERGYEKTWDYKLDYFIKKGIVTHGDDLFHIAGK